MRSPPKPIGLHAKPLDSKLLQDFDADAYYEAIMASSTGQSGNLYLRPDFLSLEELAKLDFDTAQRLLLPASTATESFKSNVPALMSATPPPGNDIVQKLEAVAQRGQLARLNAAIRLCAAHKREAQLPRTSQRDPVGSRQDAI